MMTGREEQIFKIIERVAFTKDRCPINDDLPPNAGAALRNLARNGHVRIEISGRNWRQVFILTGPNKGLSTAPNPLGDKVYRVIGLDDLTNGRTTIRRPHYYGEP